MAIDSEKVPGLSAHLFGCVVGNLHKRTFHALRLIQEAIRAHENLDDPYLESKLRSTNPDCIRASKLNTNKETFSVSYSLVNPLKEFVLFTLFVAGKLTFFFLETIVETVSAIEGALARAVPYCKVDLPFSMYAFEHFEAIQLRNTLSVAPEKELNRTFPSRFRLDDFGHYVAKALEKNPTNVAALNLAGLYWRIKGSAPNAIECFRREERTEIIFALGNLLHKAGYSGEAAVLYQNYFQLVLTDLDDALVHLAYGDALTLTMNRTEAITEFEIAHSKNPSLDAIYKASALKCDLKLISEMEKQHSNLEQTISLKNSQKERFEHVRKLEESIRRNSADAEARLQASLIYDYFTYGSLPYVDCRGLEQSGRSMMHCYLRDSDWSRYRNVVDARHQRMVKDVLCRAAPNNNGTVLWTVSDGDTASTELLSFLEALKPMYGVTMDEPMTKPLYPLEPDNINNKLLKNYLNENWPNRTYCETNRWFLFPLNHKTVPQLFMSPENKGFRVSDLLVKYLGLSPLQEHPLPWNSPFCGSLASPSRFVSSLFKLEGVKRVLSLSRSEEFAEKELKPLFQRLTGTDGEIGPRWIAFNLAALYWRIIGAPRLAVECIHGALAANADQYADVALTQLAQLVIRFASEEEHFSDAAAILNLAMKVDPNEPITHLLSGIVSHLQSKHRSALKYSRAAVVLDPQMESAVDFLVYLRCYKKIPLDYGGEESLKRISEISTPLLPNFPVSQTEVLYTGDDLGNNDYTEAWEENVAVDIIPFPEFPLSSYQILDRRQMLMYDAALPEVLPLPPKDLVESGLKYLPMVRVLEANFCSNGKTTLSMLREQATSTWVSVTAKGVNMEEFMDLSAPVPALAGFEPVCPELDMPSPLKTFDHLPAYHLRDQFIFYKPEIGLEKAFKTLGNEKERIEHVAGRLMLAMKVSKLNSNTRSRQDGGVHWTLSTASTLYWRVKGDAVNAIKCLRHSLNNAPSDMTDVALVSMANIYHQAGLLHSALISGGAALTISPKLVAVHVTLADIYASMVTLLSYLQTSSFKARLQTVEAGDYQHALQFYYSTLSLQKNFGPAKDRIRTIYCHTGKTIEF
ncbi:unnamed protein product [Enterobius vermicularis]|uniref:TPR_REGION domain-containing protein n=1 Tax=Enterobius vermicularis TaxID=51028 RepID=A0A0N4V1R5_ENTVE|nr:unnamed protein product [Enterobius vermicularis]